MRHTFFTECLSVYSVNTRSVLPKQESKQDIMCSVCLGKDVTEKRVVISILAQREDADKQRK